MSVRTITMEGFVLFDTDRAQYDSETPFRWVGGKPEMYGSAYQANAVAIVPITFALPPDFHPTAALVKALEAKRTEIQAEFARQVAEINEQIGKLQAITFEPD